MKRYVTNALIIGVVFSGIWAAMVGTPVAAQTAQPTDRQAILATEQAYQAALAKKDNAAVEKLLDRDFEWTSPNGKVWTRAEVIKNVSVLAAEKGAGDIQSMGELTPRYYGGQVGVLFRFDKDPRYTHIWVKRPGGWRALVFFDVAMNPGPEPPPNPRPDLADPEATKNCVNPCKYVPWDDKIAGRPVTVQEKEVLLTWMRLKDAENLPTSQAALNGWEGRTDGDAFLISAISPTHYTLSYRLEDMIRMWKNGIRAPGGPYVISMRLWTLGDDCVVYTALQHPSEHVTNLTSNSVRIWVKKHPPFYGIQIPNPLPWESDHIWQIALSEAIDLHEKH